MEALQHLTTGFSIAAQGMNLLYCLIGVAVGMMVGIMPGIGPVAGTALLIPITFGMEPTSAIIMLAGIYYGSMYGGTITSVLINTPGESASVVTCIDGYQMAKQGRGGTALGVAAIGSFVGGTFATVALAFSAEFLVSFALKFGPPEYFALMLFGLSLLIGLMGSSLLKGFIAALMGITISFIGLDPITGGLRFDYDSLNLLRGFDVVTVSMGLFGISEVLLSLEEAGKRVTMAKITNLIPPREEWGRTSAAIGRGTLIGFFIGIIPGANAIVSSLLSYSTEKKLAKDPSRFGKGAIEGVAGPETANNATANAAIIPLFALGLPTSPTIAVLFGAFILHGITPGPMLFRTNGDLVWAVIASLFIGNLILLVMNLPLAKYWAKLAYVPFKILGPLIMCFCAMGSFSTNYTLWDVGAVMGFGVAGYIFKKVDIPLAPIILTFVLGQQIEKSYIQSMAVSHGDPTVFFTRPISLTLMICVGLIIIVSIIASAKGKRKILAGDLE